MKNKKICIIIIIAIVIVIAIGLFNINIHNNKIIKHQKIYNGAELFDVKVTDYEYSTCIDSTNDECMYGIVLYDTIEVDNQSKVLNKIVDEFNNIILSNIEKMKSDTIDPIKYEELSKVYNTRYHYHFDKYLYSDEELMSFAIRVETIDLCDDDKYDSNFYVYYYDKVNDKEIDEKEFINRYSIIDKDVDKELKNIGVMQVKQNAIKKYFIDYYGDIYVYYKDSDISGIRKIKEV